MRQVENFAEIVVQLPELNEDQRILKQFIIDLESGTVFKGLSESSKHLLQISLSCIGGVSVSLVLQKLLENALEDVYMTFKELVSALAKISEKG